MSHLALWPQGISTECFMPSLRSKARRASLGGTGKTVYLYVGRVSAEKRLDVLLQSLPAFNRRHGDETVFWVTGDGPYRSQLENAGFLNLVLTGEKRGSRIGRNLCQCGRICVSVWHGNLWKRCFGGDGKRPSGAESQVKSAADIFAI